MPPQKTLNEKVDDFKRDLDLIGTLLEQAKREYDLYFAGARKRQPFELKQQIERLLRKWRTTNIQKLELTFRLNSLNSKYSSMCDVWEKIFKRREQDPRALSPYGPTASQFAEDLAAANRDERARQRQASRELDPESKMRDVFDQFVDAKKDMGETMGALSYDRFRAQLEKQVDQIRDKTQCKDVKFTVVRKDGKVSLTAKPVR